MEEESSARLKMRSRGRFQIGASAKGVLKAVVLCEDSTKLVSLAKQLGDAKRIPQAKISGLFSRYQNVYGQL